MNTHNCRVGTIRPNTNKTLISKVLKNRPLSLESNKQRYLGKLSK